MQSLRSKKFYAGCTDDVKRRLKEHNRKATQFDRVNAPFEMIYFEAYKSRDDAFLRERKLKRFSQGFYRILERLKFSLRN